MYLIYVLWPAVCTEDWQVSAHLSGVCLPKGIHCLWIIIVFPISSGYSGFDQSCKNSITVANTMLHLSSQNCALWMLTLCDLLPHIVKIYKCDLGESTEKAKIISRWVSSLASVLFVVPVEGECTARWNVSAGDSTARPLLGCVKNKPTGNQLRRLVILFLCSLFLFNLHFKMNFLMFQV